MRSLLSLVLLVAPFFQGVAADSVIEIVTNLKSYKDGTTALFVATAKAMEAGGEKDEAAKWNAWVNDWLSILGLNKGITGLTKDFVLHYLGRSAYHDSNGPLIGAMRKVAAAFPSAGEPANLEVAKEFRHRLLDVCEAGTSIFQKEGSMHQMLSELQMLLTEKNTPYLVTGFQASQEMAKAFKYMTGPRPGAEDDDLDDEEL